MENQIYIKIHRVIFQQLSKALKSKMFSPISKKCVLIGNCDQVASKWAKASE